MDLFIYDKVAWKCLAYINTGSVGHSAYTYAPEYDRVFPQGLRDWAVVRDYNHDGVGDIFALTANSDIAVYKGHRSGNYLSYELVNPHLMYSFGSNSVHIWTFSENMPVIMDVDGDGDIDVLAPDQAGGLTLDYYKNMSAENGYGSDSLVFVIGDQCWGRFIENSANCGISLTQCKKELHTSDPPPDIRHQGGACCGMHYRNNNVTSLLLADSYCNSLKFLENSGDTINAVVQNYDTTFPKYDVPVNLPVFPCAYMVDADNDGYEDIFVSPFASNAYQGGQSEDKKVVQYYHNIGIDSVNRFHYMGDTMLTNGMIDVGTESHPVFFDYDNDGKQDIVVGNFGEFTPFGYPKSYLTLYKNIGSDTMPAYREEDTDWNHLSAFQLNGIYPAFGDLDGDGHADMLIGESTGGIDFFRNTGTGAAAYPAMTAQNLVWTECGRKCCAPCIYDVNGDGLLDLVIGSKVNNITYFWNYGTATAPRFSTDSSNSFFGKIRVYDTHVAGQPPGYATPFLIRENNSLMLYAGAQSGYIRKYAVNRDSLRAGGFDLIDSNVLGGKPGLRSTVNLADINQDGYPEYLVGNIRGGIAIYSDINWGRLPVIAGIAERRSPQYGVLIYPNPAKDQIICRSENERLIWAELFDMMGGKIDVKSNVEDKTIKLNIEVYGNRSVCGMCKK